METFGAMLFEKGGGGYFGLEGFSWGGVAFVLGEMVLLDLVRSHRLPPLAGVLGLPSYGRGQGRGGGCVLAGVEHGGTKVFGVAV